MMLSEKTCLANLVDIFSGCYSRWKIRAKLPLRLVAFPLSCVQYSAKCRRRLYFHMFIVSCSMCCFKVISRSIAIYWSVSSVVAVGPGGADIRIKKSFSFVDPKAGKTVLHLDQNTVLKTAGRFTGDVLKANSIRTPRVGWMSVYFIPLNNSSVMHMIIPAGSSSNNFMYHLVQQIISDDNADLTFTGKFINVSGSEGVYMDSKMYQLQTEKDIVVTVNDARSVRLFTFCIFLHACNFWVYCMCLLCEIAGYLICSEPCGHSDIAFWMSVSLKYLLFTYLFSFCLNSEFECGICGGVGSFQTERYLISDSCGESSASLSSLCMCQQW